MPSAGSSPCLTSRGRMSPRGEVLLAHPSSSPHPGATHSPLAGPWRPPAPTSASASPDGFRSRRLPAFCLSSPPLPPPPEVPVCRARGFFKRGLKNKQKQTPRGSDRATALSRPRCLPSLCTLSRQTRWRLLFLPDLFFFFSNLSFYLLCIHCSCLHARRGRQIS